LRNKTINTSIEDGKKYLSRCINVNEKINDIESITGKTINGDSFEILDLLPDESVDLIIADPPYNLTKSFNGNIFAKKNSDDYEKYTRSWLLPAERIF